jgi:hypothetical protein
MYKYIFFNKYKYIYLWTEQAWDKDCVAILNFMTNEIGDHMALIVDKERWYIGVALSRVWSRTRVQGQ